MTSTPIADGLGNMEQTPNDNPGLPNRDAERYLRAAKADDQLPPGDFLGDLLEAQHRLIAAQHNFMHDTNVGALYEAQDAFIGQQSQVILRLLGKR